jgi:PAS domain S-box-containing protein
LSLRMNNANIMKSDIKYMNKLSTMSILRKIGKFIYHHWFGYTFAVGVVALATWFKILAQPDIIPANVPITYILAIVVTAFFFGLGPSILCCIISVIAFDYYFLPPLHSFLSFHIFEVPIALIFLFVGIVISYLSSSLRKKTQEANKELVTRQQHETELITYREHLEELGKQRTAQLEEVNLDLKKEINEHRSVEKRLLQSEDMLKRSQEIANLGSWELDLAGNTLTWSDEVYRIFGLKPQEFNATYEAFLESVHPDDRAAVDNAYSSSVSEGKDGYEIEHRIIRKDTGEVRFVHEKCNHVKNKQGKIVRSLGMVHDITERKKNEEALRKIREELEVRIQERTKELAEVNIALQGEIAEHKQAQEELNKARVELETRVEERTKELRETRDYLDNLINYANAPIIVWNPDFKITRFNHAFERLTGRTAKEVLGKTLDILFPDDSRDESMKHILNATSGVRWEVVEIPIKHKDGTVYILLWNSANLYAEDGKTVIATIAQGQDITERKRAEQLKDEFIGLVSHELRTPMTVITGSLRTATSAGISPKNKRILLQNAIEGAGSLATILENLLELSRYQAGRLQLHRETVDIPSITETVISRLKTRGERRFLIDFPTDLPTVEADPIRVERILYNLLENANKYSYEDSEIKVSARKENGKVITRIADNGMGISPGDLEKIFEPFERLEKGGKPRQGLGLGLVVCKRLVEAQGGQIWVESASGKGSIFSFSLPTRVKTK